MKRTIIMLMLAIGATTFAQKPDWGKTMQAEKKFYAPTIVGEDNDAIYTVDHHDDNFTFEKFDKRKMDRKYTKRLKMPDNHGKKYDYENVTFFDGNFILFASIYDRKTKTFSLKGFVIDGEHPRITDQFDIFENEVEKKRRRGDFEVVLSRNKETFLVRFAAYYKKEDKEVEMIKLYGKDLKQITEKTYETEGDGSVTASNFIIDDEGSVYFFRGDEVVILDANTDYEEWSEKIELKEQERGAYLTNMFMAIDAKNNPTIIASYITVDYKGNNENKRHRDRKKGDEQIAGMYYMKIDGLTKETMVSKVSKFDKDYLDQFRTKRDIKKGRDAEENDIYNNYNFFFKDDGGIVFVGEQQYYVEISDAQTNQTMGEDFYYNDLVTYNFSPDGNLIWANRIPKKQTFSWRQLPLGFRHGSYGWSWMTVPYYQRGYFSYMAGLSKDKLYIMYNDDKRNANVQNEADKLKYMHKIKTSVPVVYTVDLETGIKKKQMDLSFDGSNTILRPDVYYQSSQVEPMYIFAMRKKNFHFGKVDFNGEGGRGRDSAHR